VLTIPPKIEVIMCARLHLLVYVVILVIVPASFGQLKNSCRASSLPSGAKALLDGKYADWRPKDVSDLGPDDKELWLKANPKDCPGIAIGHFEEPDRVSYAVLLVPKSELKHAYKIIVLRELPTGNGYAARLLDQADGEYSSSGLVISRVPPGKYSDFEGTASVSVKVDAVNVEWIEKAAVLYYWANGKYHTIQISD
jgi:hypothetical protein